MKNWTDEQRLIAFRAIDAIEMSRARQAMLLKEAMDREAEGRGGFEWFMAKVEADSRGQIQTRDEQGELIYQPWTWKAHAENMTERKALHRAVMLASTIESTEPEFDVSRLVEFQTHGSTDQLSDCTLFELIELCSTMARLAERLGLPPMPDTQEAA